VGTFFLITFPLFPTIDLLLQFCYLIHIVGGPGIVCRFHSVDSGSHSCYGGALIHSIPFFRLILMLLFIICSVNSIDSFVGNSHSLNIVVLLIDWFHHWLIPLFMMIINGTLLLIPHFGGGVLYSMLIEFHSIRLFCVDSIPLNCPIILLDWTEPFVSFPLHYFGDSIRMNSIIVVFNVGGTFFIRLLVLVLFPTYCWWCGIDSTDLDIQLFRSWFHSLVIDHWRWLFITIYLIPVFDLFHLPSTDYIHSLIIPGGVNILGDPSVVRCL